MIIKVSNNYNYYSKKSIILGNCYDILINNNTFHYEFIIRNNQATIKTDNIDYLDLVIEEFRKTNKYISKFRTEDYKYYKAYDDVFTFKLPISIIQPSKFFINEEKLDEFDQAFDITQIILPVNIINDEYVLIDGHHRMYLAYINHFKMVDVYIDKVISSTHDFVYIAKEQNIKTIKDLKIISNQEYKELWESFYKLYNQK